MVTRPSFEFAFGDCLPGKDSDVSECFESEQKSTHFKCWFREAGAQALSPQTSSTTHWEETLPWLSELKRRSNRASTVSTTYTVSDSSHKSSINTAADLCSPMFSDSSSAIPQVVKEVVFPSSKPELKRTVYCELALRPRGGQTAKGLFEQLAEEEVERVRSNTLELQAVLDTLDDTMEFVSIRHSRSRLRGSDVTVTLPCSSSLLQRRSMTFEESALQL